MATKVFQVSRGGEVDLPASWLPENATRIGEISSFDQPSETYQAHQLNEDGAVPAKITLKSGTSLCNIHHVIICTGYLYLVSLSPTSRTIPR